MMVVRGTKKFLDRVGERPGVSDVMSTGVLGDWYVTPLFWRPQVALFVNERSYLSVLVPLAPVRTVGDRMPDAFAEVAIRIGVAPDPVEHELDAMRDHVLAKTASRRVLGVMNEFAFLADRFRQERDDVDLIDLALWLAQVPTSPLYKTNVSPDRELRALLDDGGPSE